MRRAQLIVVSLALFAASAASWRATCEWSRRATLPSPGVALLRACATAAEEGPSAAVSSPSASTAAPHVERELGDHHAESMRLLDSLDAWLRRQTVASVLPSVMHTQSRKQMLSARSRRSTSGGGRATPRDSPGQRARAMAAFCRCMGLLWTFSTKPDAAATATCVQLIDHDARAQLAAVRH